DHHLPICVRRRIRRRRARDPVRLRQGLARRSGWPSAGRLRASAPDAPDRSSPSCAPLSRPLPRGIPPTLPRHGDAVGARKGTITTTLFHVDGDVPREYRDDYLAQIEEFRFQPLTPAAEEDVRHGWTTFDDMLSTEFSRDNVFFEDY